MARRPARELTRWMRVPRHSQHALLEFLHDLRRAADAKTLAFGLRGAVCDACAMRSGRVIRLKPIIVVASVGLAAFALGRYLRPPPPPLIIQRAANSPLSDLPIKLDAIATSESNVRSPGAAPVDETVYLCGARTQKGTPCRRRVHVLGQRCYQHKGRTAMVALEKLVIK